MTTSLQRVSDRLFGALVFLLPLHTVYLYAWVAWKPWIVLLALVAALDLISGRIFSRGKPLVIGITIFLVAVLLSGPHPEAVTAYVRLALALVTGGLLALVIGARAGDLDRVLRTIFWSAAAMGATGLLLGLATNGAFGEAAVSWIGDIPLVDRVNKPAYLDGFVALTNWHQDPGYAALWSNLWFVLAGHAWLRGLVRAPAWVGPVVLGGVATTSVLALSRTGWFGLVVAALALVVTRWKQSGRAIRLVAGAAAVSIVLLAVLFVTDRPGVGNEMFDAFLFRAFNIVELGPVQIPGEPPPPSDLPGDHRSHVWGLYWNRFVSSPVRGTGLGSGWALDLQEPHNLALQLLGETGLLGLLGFAAMLVFVARSSGRPGPEATAAMGVVILAAFAQTVLFESILWLVIGLWYAGGVRRREAASHRQVEASPAA